MSRLPGCSWEEVVRVLNRLGYAVDQQTGSHIVLRHFDSRRLTVPRHRELAKGTLRAPIRQAGLIRDEFIAMLRRAGRPFSGISAVHRVLQSLTFG